jgi:signal transduction histidine kinase
MLRELFKRTQVRLAATIAAIFALATSALFGLLVFNLSDELEAAARARIMRVKDVFLAVDRKYGFDELVSVVADEADSLRDSDSIYLLLGDDGQIYAGNVRRVLPFEGWRKIPRSSLPSVTSLGSPQDNFFSIWTPVSKGKLFVGGSDREVRQARRILLHSVGWGLLITAALSIAAGVRLAQRAQRRIDDIGATLAAVSEGQLERRIDTGGQNDDLDDVARRINAMLERLQRLMQSVNQASTDVAHELKKPMMRLREKLEAASEKATSVGEFKEAVDDALVQSDAIVATFEALLNISQLQAGTRKERFVDVDLRQIVRDVEELYGPVVEDEGGTLSAVIPADINAVIRGDRGLLVQLCANLIENSLRHTSGPVAIVLRLSQGASSGLVLEVADNGPGIPADEHAKVFRRFYRIEHATPADGHGLGLSLVAALADLHGATIELSDNSPGLRVVIRFPAVAARNITEKVIGGPSTRKTELPS